MTVPYLVASFRSQLAALAMEEGSAVAGPTPLPDAYAAVGQVERRNVEARVSRHPSTGAERDRVPIGEIRWSRRPAPFAAFPPASSVREAHRPLCRGLSVLAWELVSASASKRNYLRTNSGHRRKPAERLMLWRFLRNDELAYIPQNANGEVTANHSFIGNCSMPSARIEMVTNCGNLNEPWD